MFKLKNPASLKTSTRPLGKIKPMSTRNIVKKHLKEWNKDEDEEIEEEDLEEYFLGPDPRKHKDFKHFSGN